MSDDTTADGRDDRDAGEHRPPEGVATTLSWTDPDGVVHEVAVEAGWTVLRRREKPTAEVFSVAYTLPPDDGARRPVTFVFNGGPGAASAYLHVGLVGPRRVAFGDDGELPRMPPRLVDNPSSWLAFTDLVFLDPVGTGYSRTIPRKGSEGADGDGDGEQDTSYYKPLADLDALGQTIQRWLSANARWGSPVFVAGESYGGYRVARMTRRLQEHHGVGLAGALLVSPAIDLATFEHTDVNVLSWVDRVPTMAAAAQHHGRAREAATEDETVAFATGDLARLYILGDAMPADDREAIHARFAALVGLSDDVVARYRARLSYSAFARELLRDEQRVVGLYDARMATVDPFPDREPFAGPDPSLAGIAPAFTTAVNELLSGVLGVRTDRTYELLSMDVFKAWRADEQDHAMDLPVGATDDLRYGLQLNPHLRVHVVHGRHDLVTPWYASQRLVDLMRLDPDARSRIELEVHDGGHMFYTLASSRDAYTASVAAFVASALG